MYSFILYSAIYLINLINAVNLVNCFFRVNQFYLVPSNSTINDVNKMTRCNAVNTTHIFFPFMLYTFELNFP